MKIMKTEDEFKAKILEVMKEFGVTLEESENFDYERVYTGSDYVFRGKGFYLNVKELV